MSVIVLTARLGLLGEPLLTAFVREAGLTVVAFTEEHWRIASDAFARFGKGRHAAALNFGDCLTYALASTSGEPLLCLGNDFAQTDLTLA